MNDNEVKLTKLVNELDLRFTSGNSNEVQSARLTKDEWNLIKPFLEYILAGGCSQ